MQFLFLDNTKIFSMREDQTTGFRVQEDDNDEIYAFFYNLFKVKSLEFMGKILARWYKFYVSRRM